MNKVFLYKKYWFFFFLIKFLYMIVAIFVYSNFTQLGDNASYLDGYHYFPSAMFYSSTAMIGTVASTLSSIFGTFITNFLFFLLSFYGIYYSVNKLDLNNKQLFYILFLLSLPSFGMWSSIAGKEAVAVFFMGILAGFLIDYYQRARFMNFLEIFALYLGIIFKPHFIFPVILMIFYLKLKRVLKIKRYNNIFLLLLLLFIIIYVMWLFRCDMNEFSLIMANHFSEDGKATREVSFWLNDFDYIYKLHEGMWLSFVGPTLQESLQRIEILPFYIESIYILCIFILICIKGFNYKKINLLSLSSFFILIVGILAFSYPFGVSNYGAAIRYREGYYSFIVVMLFYIFITHFNGLNKKERIEFE